MIKEVFEIAVNVDFQSVFFRNAWNLLKIYFSHQHTKMISKYIKK